MPLLFVYGTLKRGDVRAASMSGQVYLGDAVTFPRYRLVDCGAYPGLVESPISGVAVRGEVYNVTTEQLPVLDDVEGVNEGLYARREIGLLPPFQDQRVEAYFFLGPIEGLPDCGAEWTRRS